MHALLTARGQRTRDRLLSAAKQALVEGAGDMSHADVAARAGVSAGAPYRYFPSKSRLIVAVVERFFDDLEAVAYVPTFEDEAADWWGREQVRIARLVGYFFDDPLGPFIAQGMAADAEVADTGKFDRKAYNQAYAAERRAARARERAQRT